MNNCSVKTIKALVKKFSKDKYKVKYVKNSIMEDQIKATISLREGGDIITLSLFPKEYYNFKLLTKVEVDELPFKLQLVEPKDLTEVDLVLNHYLDLGYGIYCLPCTKSNIVLMHEEVDMVTLLSIYL